jgi:hypothetical protein
MIQIFQICNLVYQLILNQIILMHYFYRYVYYKKLQLQHFKTTFEVLQ